MNQNVVSVKPHDMAQDAWEIMKRRHFSQLPVVGGSGRILGAISESSLLSHEAGHRRVEEAMGDPFPIVGKNTRLSVLASILRKERAVLVVDEGKLAGIVTQYDLIDRALKKGPSDFS